MAKSKKPRKQYRGRDSSVTPQVIRIEAKQKSALVNWWIDNKQTVIIRLIQLGVLGILSGIGLLIWNLLN